jgi:hypothetical protein
MFWKLRCIFWNLPPKWPPATPYLHLWLAYFVATEGGRGVDINTKNSIMTVLHGGAKGKVPMLCVMVKQLTLSDTDASMLLVDPSGITITPL